jgi:hypothetical protein
MNRIRTALALAVAISTAATPAGALLDPTFRLPAGSVERHGTSTIYAVEVERRGNVITVHVPADGERYTVDGIGSVQAGADPRSHIAVSCHFTLNPVVSGFVQQWPSIINSGAVDCRIAPSAYPGDGEPAFMIAVTLQSKLKQLTRWSDVLVWETKATKWKNWGSGYVTNAWYALAMATCVSAFNYEYMRQGFEGGFLAQGGIMQYGGGDGPINVIYGCQRL